MTPVLNAFSGALIHFAWQGLVVFVLLRATLFLLRLVRIQHQSISDLAVPGNFEYKRHKSPPPGRSILITSAPKSDITVAAAGPAT